MEQPVYKRRRVFRACDRCRELKAKCDGNRPSCGRCIGYGHECCWDLSHRSTAKQATLPAEAKNKVKRLTGVLQKVRVRLTDDERRLLDRELHALHDGQYSDDPDDEDETAQGKSEHNSERYLGEASDVAFYNLVKHNLCSPVSLTAESDGHCEVEKLSYEQNEKEIQSRSYQFSRVIPSKANADKYVNIYFSTIHIAYPFIPRVAFEQAYQEWWDTGAQSGFSAVWTALLLTMFAIGACYERLSLSSTDDDDKDTPGHREIFSKAQSMLSRYQETRHMDFVCTLLAQCFYLLATSQTDACWLTLGDAVRIAQAIGMHTESVATLKCDESYEPIQERRRRTWYSIYVLDRLVSLQLGRPFAIHRSFQNLVLPSTDAEIDTCVAEAPPIVENTLGEYFRAMIRFSDVIGEVLEGLYGPCKSTCAETLVSTIQRCDHKLLLWKSELPRRLRFDLGHTFDNSTIFKRQRNMLAMKFYHLRSLIHRPMISGSSYYALPLDTTGEFLSHRQVHLTFKKICVESAQKTAHLLYGLEDKRNLVHDFPWWQMISCLICASSILLVARLDVDSAELGQWLDMDAVEEDADICLKVFSALSTNSTAARLAGDMMRALKESRTRRQGESMKKFQYHGEHHHGLVDRDVSPILDHHANGQDAAILPTSSTLEGTTSAPHLNVDSFVDFSASYEISEPIIWSAQFLAAEFNPFQDSYDHRIQ